MGKNQRIYAVANWKMHGKRASLAVFDALASHSWPQRVTAIYALPFTLLHAAGEKFSALGEKSARPGFLAAQDCHMEDAGAHTGCISASMLVDLGVTHVLLGHSERRAEQKEEDAMIARKRQRATENGLIPVCCVGETGEERQKGLAQDVVSRQVEALASEDAGEMMLAYEPRWAIGAQKTPQAGVIATMLRCIRRNCPAQTPLLYGGSVDAANAGMICSQTQANGVLVGGASLRAADWMAIMRVLGSGQD